MGEQIKLPALNAFEDRLSVLVQGEWSGQRIAQTLTVDYWLMCEESPHIEADDVQVLQLWGADGKALLDYFGVWKLSPHGGYLARAAAAAVAGAISEDCRQQADEWLGYEGWPGGADFAGNLHQMTIIRGVL
jgi:hypothetical protein